jgi:monoamine oxidase
MERRDFLKASTLASVGIGLTPSMLLSCSKFPKLKKGSFSGSVLIIGAGVSGIYAGYLLNDLGIDYKILEASAKVGGRMGKLTGFADYTLDLGAQWLHGKKNIIGKAIRQSKTKITRDDTDLTFWFDGQRKSQLPNNPFDIFEASNLPDVSYLEFAASRGFLQPYRFILENMAGDQGTSASRLSAYWNQKEEEFWSSGDKDYKFQHSYYDFILEEFITKVSTQVILNCQAKEIQYAGEKIIVTNQNGEEFESTHVIVTVPITVLKEGDISFNPPLPFDKTQAFEKIGMDAGMKVFLKFSEQFYDDNVVGGKVCAAYANEKIGKTGSDHVLLAFVMGEQAEALTVLEESEVVNKLLEELDEMYEGKASTTFISAYVQDWSKHPFIRGAYSYSTVGMGDVRKIAASSVENKIFFAGEAMHLAGHHQTVQGAAESAYFSVAEMLG